MTGDGLTLADRFERHFSGDTLYAVLGPLLADDLRAGGVVARICVGWEGASAGDVVQLRLLAGLCRELLPCYPCLGGAASPHDAAL